MDVNNHIGEGVEIGNGAAITNSRTFNASLFGKRVDSFTTGPLMVESTEERTIAIKGDTLDASQFPIEILDAAFAFDKLFMLARLASVVGKEQGTLEALGSKAIGVVELHGGMHRQADGAARSAISQASKGGLGRFSEWDSGDAPMASGGFVDIPCIISSISGEIGWEVIECKNGLMVKRAKIRDVIVVEGVSVFGKHNGSILGDDGGSNTGPIAPDEFFLLFCRAIGLLLVGAAFHAEAAIRIAFRHAGLVVAIFDVGTLIVLLDPGLNMLHIESDGFTQAGDLCL